MNARLYAEKKTAPGTLHFDEKILIVLLQRAAGPIRDLASSQKQPVQIGFIPLSLTTIPIHQSG